MSLRCEKTFLSFSLALCKDLSLSLSLSMHLSLSLCTYHSTSAQLLQEQRTEARQEQELPACRAWARIHHTAAIFWQAQWSSPATGRSLLCSLHTSSTLKTYVQHQQASTQSASRQEHTPRELSISLQVLCGGEGGGGRVSVRESNSHTQLCVCELDSLSLQTSLYLSIALSLSLSFT